jgi:hypothetical protein
MDAGSDNESCERRFDQDGMPEAWNAGTDRSFKPQTAFPVERLAGDRDGTVIALCPATAYPISR